MSTQGTSLWWATVCLCAVVHTAQAGNDLRDSTHVTSEAKLNFFSTLLHDQTAIWSAPFRMDEDDAVAVGSILATTAVLVAIDEHVYDTFRDYQNRNGWVKKASPIASQFGEFYVPFGVAGAYCLAGLVLKENDTFNTGLLAVQAMVHSGIVIQVMKHIFGRTRPFVKSGADNWYGPRGMFKRYHDGGFSPYDSFPSGHTITAFSLATVIAERSDVFWVDALAYSFAGLCGLSRLTEHDHWFSDVFVGATLGISIGKLVVKSHEQRVEVMPAIGIHSAGVTVRIGY